MKHKSELSHHSSLSAEEVKNLDLDEQPRPTRKLGSTAVPSMESSTSIQNPKRITGITKRK
jgi:hypothetical protein